jgi:hypothetical protein
MAADTFRLKLPIQPLVSQMLDQLPDSVWQDPTIRFLDIAFGGGQFVLEIRRRLLAAGHSQQNVADRIWGCESLLTRVKYVQNWFKSGLHNLHVRDPLTHDWGDMKFDVVVGNPPYQSNESSGKKLWPLFIEKSFELLNPNGYLAMVTPATWVNRPQGRSYQQITTMLFTHNHLQYVNPDVNHHFEIGETVASWVLHKTGAHNLVTHVHHDGHTHQIRYEAQPLALTTDAKLTLEIMQKLDAWTGMRLKDVVYNDVQGKSIEWYLAHHMLFERAGATRVPVFWTAANKDKYFTTRKLQRQGHKVIVNLSGYYYQDTDPLKYMMVDVNNAYAIGAGALGVPCDTVKHACNCAQYLKSKLYQFYVNNEKTSGFNTGILKLPYLDVNVTYTDADIYQLFKLTPDQIEFVNQNFHTKTS